MALDLDKFIIPDGTPSGTVQAMKSAAYGPGDFGWKYYADSARTAGSPLQLNSGNSHSATLPCDGLGTSSESAYWPSGLTPEPWNAGMSKIEVIKEGDLYDVQVSFKVGDGSSSELLDLSLNVGGGVGEIYRESKMIDNGASTVTSVTFSFQVFASSTFVTNGGTFTVSSDGTDMDIWDISILMHRKFTA